MRLLSILRHEIADPASKIRDYLDGDVFDFVKRAESRLDFDCLQPMPRAQPPRFSWVLAELERRQVPVFVHPVDSPCIEVLGFGRPSSMFEFPVDTAPNITCGL